MRDLRPDGLSDDGRSMLLSDAEAAAGGEPAGERYRVAVDERFRSVLRGRTTPSSDTRVESALPPREIQARLRAGASVEDVARAAGIPVARVQRYEVPIAAERSRVVSEARGATVPPADRTHPGRQLGQLVDARLQRDGLDPAALTWEACRQTDGSWLVGLPLEGGTAQFSWDPAARRIRPVDALALDLLQPAPVPREESIEAVAEATGVATNAFEDDVPIAVGAEGRRGSGRSPSSTRPANGLVVVAGARADELQVKGVVPAPLAASAGQQVYEELEPVGVPGAVWEPASPPLPPAPTTAGVADELTVPGGGHGSLGAAVADASSDGFTEPGGGLEGVAVAAATADAGALDKLFAAGEASGASAPGAKAPAARGARRAAGRRGQVPAWDDIVFGAKRP